MTETLRRDANSATGTVILIQDIADDKGFETAVRELVSAGGIADNSQFENVHLEVLRCAEAWIWDAYGSLMRSIVSQVACASGPVKVVVAGYDGSTVSPQPALADNFGTSPAAETAQYLMRHVLNVDPVEWFRTGDIHDRVRQTVQVISEHPLLPDSLQVYGFIFSPTKGVCEQIM